ncbi:MAG TPA: DNA-processing protein DprA [Clostridia bacterium]|jgi:DNA processing protein
MEDQRLLYFWLSAADASPFKINPLIKETGGIYNFYEFFRKGDLKVKEVLGSSYSKMLNALNFERLKRQLKRYENDGLGILTPEDKEYPPSFLELNDAPFVIYYKGRLELLSSKCFTIVGTRSPSLYGKKMTKIFAQELSSSGFTIVSGLATGIDSFAHRFTLDIGGDTIAILGNGHNEIYPAVNYELYKEIAQKGLVISEFLPEFKGTVYSYPRRNRLLAALSMGVLVAEAGEKSGTMYTVEYALEQGKSVFALAGAADNPKILGNLRLIRYSQCALVYKPEHILEDLNITYAPQHKPQPKLDSSEQKILDLLANGALNYDKILYSANLPASELNSLLSIMEIKGLITKNGTVYSLA